MKILKVTASAEHEGSHTRAVTDYLVSQFSDAEVRVTDLAKEPLPLMSSFDLMAMYHGDEGGESLNKHLSLSESLVADLEWADVLVLGVPMYNFSVPVYLKQWIDLVARRGRTFRYTENGPEGLLKLDRAFVVTSTGGTPLGSDADFASRYVEFILGFLGIDTVHHVDASRAMGDPEGVRDRAMAQVDELLSSISLAA